MGGAVLEEKKILSPPGSAEGEALLRLREAGAGLLLWLLGRDGAFSLLRLGAGLLAPAQAAAPAFLWWAQVLAGYGVGLPLAVWWLLRRPDSPPERRERPPGRLARDALALVGMCYAANLLTLALLGGGGEAAESGEPVALLAVRTCLLAPLAEEYFFRRLLLERLRPLGARFALAAAAVCFAFFHGSAGQWLYALVAGLVLGAVALETGRLWPCVVLHMGNNLLALLSPLWLDWLGERSGPVLALVAAAGCLAGVSLARETAKAFPSGRRENWRLFWRSAWLPMALLYQCYALFLRG